jgi:hypothetical protein
MRGLLELIEQKILLNVVEIVVNYCYGLCFIFCLFNIEFFIFKSLEMVNAMEQHV